MKRESAMYRLKDGQKSTFQNVIWSGARYIDEACERMGYHYKVGNVLSSDIFYDENPETDKWMKMGVLGVEMEAAALYMNAARAGKKALAICTVSDHLLTGEASSPEERQTTFTHMMDVALSLV